MTRKAAVVILLAFVGSLLVRAPHLDRPLSAHHEYCTAFTLIALTNWYEDGFRAHHGVPSGGFVREGQRHFPSTLSPQERATGLYYFSHPPLAYDLPYGIFRLLGQAPNVLGLQILNLLFHLLSVFVFYCVVREFMPNAGEQRVPLFAALLYIFMPAPLWFHSNAYMSDLFVQNFWILHLLFAMRLFKGDPTRLVRIGFTISLFLTVWTSWLGVLAAGADLFLVLWRRRSGKFPVTVTISLVLLAAFSALGLAAWRYMQVIDGPLLLSHLQARLEVRGTQLAADGTWQHVRQLIVNYRMGYLPLLLVVVSSAYYRVTRNTRPFHTDKASLHIFLVLAGLPVLVEHVLLLQYAEHDFVVLKAGPILCALAALAIVQFPLRSANIALALTCLAGVLYFYRINPIPGMDNGRYGQEMELGQFIRAHAREEEVVFVIGLSAEPQVMWYAHRNILRVGSVQDAMGFLRDRGLSRGVVFEQDGERIDLQRLGP